MVVKEKQNVLQVLKEICSETERILYYHKSYEEEILYGLPGVLYGLLKIKDFFKILIHFNNLKEFMKCLMKLNDFIKKLYKIIV